jgi:hypothetical protein
MERGTPSLLIFKRKFFRWTAKVHGLKIGLACFEGVLHVLFPVHGNRKFVQISVLEDQGYMDRNGEFQLEFCIANIHSSYEHKFRINQSIFAANSSKMTKLESSYFSFGIYDWSLSIYPSGRSDSQLGKLNLHFFLTIGDYLRGR